MAYVLIVFFSQPYMHTGITMHDFGSLESCQAAKAQIEAKIGGDGGAAACVAK